LPHTFKDLTAALLRQVEVEQKQVGTRDGIAIDVLYKVHTLFAIVEYTQIKVEARLF